MQTDVIIFTELAGQGGNIGKIILNRPQNLNALNEEMCIALKARLQQWAEDESIKAVIISGGGGRAFCAGGDIRAIYKICQEEKNYFKAMEFFQIEYALNELIFNFPKPYIAFLDGITMGGGFGISIHGSHPIATERLALAMPETGIGFFPDIGAGYHLSRLPNYVGDYLGLTGEKIGARDAYRLDLVKAIVASDDLANLELALIAAPFASDDFSAVTHIIAQFHFEPNLPLDLEIPHITKIFAGRSVEEILESLSQFPQPWGLTTAANLLTKSPLSLKITYEHLQRCSQLDFSQIMGENINLTSKFIRNHDFLEGIRAAVIDKDRQPLWRPATLAEVSSSLVNNYFDELNSI